MTKPDLLNTPEVMKAKKAAYVQISEQPAGKGLRFRYECEGRSAGSIPGVSSTQDNRTFPKIQVVGYTGRAVVVVSSVTSEPPYRPHPHNLVGKDGCKKGVCTLELGEDMSCSFPSLGIQCVKKKDIEDSLGLRQQIRVDPFQTGFTHKTNPSGMDLNCVRLAFQVFLEGNEPGAFTFALKPVVSDPIYDKKSKCDLTICRLTETSASVAGGKEILLFCEKVTKDDVQVRFYEEQDGQMIWEGLAEFQPSDVHKQFGICFKSPKYHNIEVEHPVKVKVQLRRPSDGAVSESREFELLPLDAGRSYFSAKRLKTNYTVFNQILYVDHALQAEELKHKNNTGYGSFASPPQLPNTSFSNPVSNNQPIKVEGSSAVSQPGGSVGGPHQLKPVAMPGSRFSQPSLMPALSSSGLQPSSSGLQPSSSQLPAMPALMPLTSMSSCLPSSSNMASGAYMSSGSSMASSVAMPAHASNTLPLYSSLSGYRLNNEDVKLPLPERPLTMMDPPGIGDNKWSSTGGDNKWSSTGGDNKWNQSSGLSNDDFPPPPPRMPRPLSDMSLTSELTQTDMASVTTRQSVNEILSMADIPINSDTESMNIDGFSIDSLYPGDQDIKPPLTDLSLKPESCYPGVSTWKPDSSTVSNLAQWKDCNSMSNLGEWKDELGSTTSIDTVKQILSPDSTMNIESQLNGSNIDIDQIYDDVISCVYDDVDSKYDDLSLAGEPPAPPIRRRGTIGPGDVTGIADKPLPTTPKNPSLITLFSEKKNELFKEKDGEKKRVQDEAKRREEEAKRREKEEKERRKVEEKERKRIEEEERKQQQHTDKVNQSLFQRLFQRTKSKQEEDMIINSSGMDENMGDYPEPTAPTESFAINQDPVPGVSFGDQQRGYGDQQETNHSFGDQFADLEQIMSQNPGATLQRLDSVVNDFTRQYPTQLSSTDNNIVIDNNNLGDNKMAVPTVL